MSDSASVTVSGDGTANLTISVQDLAGLLRDSVRYNRSLGLPEMAEVPQRLLTELSDLAATR